MGSPDYRETLTYVAEQLNGYDLAILDVIDGLKFSFHELGEPVTLGELRGVYSGRLMGNCDYERDDAEQRIADGHADLIAIGRPFISNPDLAERFANDWEFNDPAPTDVWYSFDAEGYVDFPSYQEAKEGELSESVRQEKSQRVSIGETEGERQYSWYDLQRESCSAARLIVG